MGGRSGQHPEAGWPGPGHCPLWRSASSVIHWNMFLDRPRWVCALERHNGEPLLQTPALSRSRRSVRSASDIGVGGSWTACKLNPARDVCGSEGEGGFQQSQYGQRPLADSYVIFSWQRGRAIWHSAVTSKPKVGPFAQYSALPFSIALVALRYSHT